MIGAAVGAVAGGLTGKGVGEQIDPTSEDDWLRDQFPHRPYVRPGETFEDYEEAYRFGGEAEARSSGRSFVDVEEDLGLEWGRRPHRSGMDWSRARHAVWDAYERAAQIRLERLRGESPPIRPGSVRSRVEKDDVSPEREARARDARRFRVHLDPGDAPAELITELYLALDNLYRAHGGSGLRFADDSDAMTGEEVAR